MSQVELFKKVIQKDISNILGVKVSQEKAWELYKAMFESSVNHTLDSNDLNFPIKGVATFKILTLASGNKQLKVYPSTSYQDKIRELLG